MNMMTKVKTFLLYIRSTVRSFLPRYYEVQRIKGRSNFIAKLVLPQNAVTYIFRDRKTDVIAGCRLYDKPLLASYSRSGTNWIRYIIEYISGCPTPGQFRLHNGSDFMIDRAHQAYPIMHKHGSVILVIRDYRECLLRHNTELWNETGDVRSFLEDDSVKQPANWYIKNIQTFEEFTGRKLLLYYEDLISNSEEAVRELSRFLEMDQDRTNEFVATIETRSAESVGAYVSGGHKSSTSSNLNDFRYHARKHLTPEQMVEFDEYYKREYPAIFHKYLTRYSIS